MEPGTMSLVVMKNAKKRKGFSIKVIATKTF